MGSALGLGKPKLGLLGQILIFSMRECLNLVGQSLSKLALLKFFRQYMSECLVFGPGHTSQSLATQAFFRPSSSRERKQLKVCSWGATVPLSKNSLSCGELMIIVTAWCIFWAY